jgi:hypothetical protein
MNARIMAIKLGIPALLVLGGSILPFAGCGGESNNNPAPTQRDSGTDTTTSHPEAGSGQDGAGGGDTGHETSLPDTGSCESDSSSCNTCYTDAQAATDPYNACSPYAKNCVPVTLTVPSYPPL